MRSRQYNLASLFQSISSSRCSLLFLEPFHTCFVIVYKYIQISAISNSCLQLNKEGLQDVEFHLDLKDVVHVGSSIDQRLQNLLLQGKVKCNLLFQNTLCIHLCIVEVACVDIELNRKVALHPLLQILHRLDLFWVQRSSLALAAASPDGEAR